MKYLQMKQLAIAICAAAVSATGFAQNKAPYPGYSLAFEEEFDWGSVPDESKWEYETGMARNHEDQVYTRDNATVADGCLVIEARRERVPNPDYRPSSSEWNRKNRYGEYSSASLILKDPYRYHYGVYEVRAKIPVGTGYWPAIWGCGDRYEWPYNGELDIMEYYGDAIHANLAWGGGGRWDAKWASEAPRMSEFEEDFADKFHIWRAEWDHNSLRIYLDDRLLNETDLDRTVNANPGQPWYDVDGYNPYRDPENRFGVWLNLALGGDNGGPLTDTAFPAQYLIDYVRVYTPDSEDAPLIYRIAKAEKMLADTPVRGNVGEVSAKALSDAIAAARKHLGATDVNVIDSALDALQASMDAYKNAMDACNN